MQKMAVQQTFSGKRVLVTGGGRGLGYEVVKKFYDAGATVFALDKESGLLTKLKTELPGVETICVDLGNWDESRAAVEAILPIDHLVNNAALYIAGYIDEIKQEHIDALFSINLKAVINLSQVVIKGIKDRGSSTGGTIVNISSLVDAMSIKGGCMYGCTKAALSMLTKNMALELGELNIRVNAVNPGVMKTEFFNSIDEKYRSNSYPILERQVLKSDLKPSEAADSVFFLSSPAASMITGAILRVDGGITL